MTPHKKPRNNARKAAARAYQRKTGSSYKQALAAIENPPRAARVVTAAGVDSYSGSTVVYFVIAAVQEAMQALEIAPPRPEWAPDWWKPSRSTSTWQRRNDDAYMILAAIHNELTIWWAIATQTHIACEYAQVATNPGAVSFGAGHGVPLRLELPAESSLATLTPVCGPNEPLALSDRDSGWPQLLLALLNEVHQHLVPFTGEPVDEMRAEVDRLVQWLTAG